MSEFSNLIDLAEKFKKNGEYQKAIESWEKILKLKPSYSTAWIMMGQLYEKLNLESRALVCYKEALKINPKNDDAVWCLNNLSRAKQSSEDPYFTRTSVKEKIMGYNDIIAKYRGTPSKTHFTDIGYILEQISYKPLIYECIKNGIIYQVPPPLEGYYFVDRLDNNIEYWTAINQKYYVEAGTPYYRSNNKNHLILTEIHENFEWRYEGGFIGSLIDSKDVQEKDLSDIHEISRLGFDVPDYALIKEITIPEIYECSFTMFADSMKLFKSEKEYLKSQEQQYSSKFGKVISSKVFNPATNKTENLKIKPGFSPKSFIPTGLFGGNRKASALINGEIIEVKKEKNQRTKLQFYVLKIDTFGLNVDLVADSRHFSSKVTKNQFISCNVWVIGHITNNWDEKYIIKNSSEIRRIRETILKNLREFSSPRDPNPYKD